MWLERGVLYSRERGCVSLTFILNLQRNNVGISVMIHYYGHWTGHFFFH